jgi:hypothetical protein
MEELTHQHDWMTIPVLPCESIVETLAFWEGLGFTVTYRQTRPYQYGVVKRGDYALHFARMKGLDRAKNVYNGCLVMVSDVAQVHQEFARKLKQQFGKVPQAGIPRISRMKPGATRFTLTDVSGNWIIFIQHGEKDQQTWEKADDPNQTPLQKSIATAIRFRDYKEDATAAAATLEAALRKAINERPIDIAEAWIIRLGLAREMNDFERIDTYKTRLHEMNLPEAELKPLLHKHQVEL